VNSSKIQFKRLPLAPLLLFKPSFFCNFLIKRLKINLKLFTPMKRPSSACSLSLFLLLCVTFYGMAQKPVRILSHPQQVRIERLYRLNSPFRETNPSITPDGRYLYFMSTRGGKPWSEARRRPDGSYEYDGDIYYSLKENGTWSAPVCLPPPINTWNGEDEPVVTPDGNSVYFQSWEGWEIKKGPYQMAQIVNGKWINPVGLGDGITKYFFDQAAMGRELATDGMTISPDGNLFIVATGPYYGNMDLYYSRRDASGKWSYLRKLPISTPGNDRHPFIAGDGKTLFFSSDGYGGFGGLDIFKVVMYSEEQFGEVVNIGSPFNTAGDDECFIITADGTEAYFTRNGDLFYANVEKANPALKPQPTVLLAGKLIDAHTQAAIEGSVVVTNAKGEVLAQGRSTTKGEFSLVINDLSGTYFVKGTATNYQPNSIRIEVGAIKSTVRLNAIVPLTSKARLAQIEEERRRIEEEERLRIWKMYEEAQAAVTTGIMALERIN
jgi:hypothetical protein